MKYLTLIFLLFMTVAAFGQTPKVTSLHLYVMDCNNQRLKSYWESKDSVTLVQLPEHNTLFEFVPGYQSSFPIQFGYMPISDYELTFTNIFDEKVITKITLEDQAINKVKICPDTLARPLTQNALSKLQEGDSLVIEFNSAGCFHFEDFTLTIVRTKESYLARLYDTYLTEEFEVSDKRFVASVKLDSTQLLTFRKFENELNLIKTGGGCTSRDHYEITSKYLNLTKTDDGCKWDGFYNLKTAFFGE